MPSRHPSYSNPSRKTLALASVSSIVFLISYLIGFHHSPFIITLQCTIPSSSQASELDFTLHNSAASLISISPTHLPSIPFCSVNFTHHCPCEDPNRESLFTTKYYSQHARHCPSLTDRSSSCRIPFPTSYSVPIPWPESRRNVWFANVPFKKLTTQKSDQNWVRIDGDKLVFPGGGTSFPHGVEEYVGSVSKVVPLKTGEIRTVLDIRCGVASFGNHLLDYNVLTLSVAPRDIHEAQVQFALERGLPAMLGVLSVFRLPYPSRSFDMAHCARCLIKWASREGQYLLEIDRILRPGGFWVLSGPPINWKKSYKGWERTPEDLEKEQNGIEDLAKRLCWKKVAEKPPIAVWRKPINHIRCFAKSNNSKSIRFCEGGDSDAVWYGEMQACITPLPKIEQILDRAGGLLSKWPKRLNDMPPRIKNWSIKGVTAETFNYDNRIWNKRIKNYDMHINFSLAGKYRNVMDMNAYIGGFAAVLAKYPVWVMNVVPVNASIDTLGIIYERGLIETYMNWCEAFSTYPRTYDLIHADGIFRIYMNKCHFIDILLEIDRILRPEGTVIIRDHIDIIVKVKNEAERLAWQCRMYHGENGPFQTEKLLIVSKYIKS